VTQYFNLIEKENKQEKHTLSLHHSLVQKEYFDKAFKKRLSGLVQEGSLMQRAGNIFCYTVNRNAENDRMTSFHELE